MKEEVKEQEQNGARPLLPAVFVGQKLYREVSVRNSPPEIKEYEVESIARKYIYLKGLGKDYPVNKETLWHENKNYSQSSFKLHTDKQSILDRRERDRLCAELQRHFSWAGHSKRNTLEELRECAKILKLPSENGR